MLKKSFGSTLLVCSISCFSILGVASSYAATQTDTFNVTATIIASCTISAGDLAFGNYDPLAVADNDATSTIAVTCSNGAGYAITLSAGLSGNDAARTMDDDATGTSFLSYQMFTDAARTNNWDNTTGLTGQTGTGSNQNHTVYGRIPAGQTTPVVGAYTDTITATITY